MPDPIDPDELDGPEVVADDDDDEVTEGDLMTFGAADGIDFGSLLQQAQAMQEQLVAAQQEAAQQVVEGHAGGGLVRITITGGMEVQRVRIDRSVVDPDDVEMLEDLLTAAFHDAVSQASLLGQSALGGLDLGAALGGLGGLFGSDGDEIEPGP